MNFKETFPLQVVINLDKRPDRLKICMEEEFPKLGIVPIRKPGVIVTQEGVPPQWLGAVGCMLSHYQSLLAAQAIDTNIFIWEDDVFLKNNSLDVLDKACEELPDDWDMIYAGGNVLKPFYRYSEHLARLSHSQSTVGYGVSKKFVPVLLKYIEQNLNPVKMQIDVLYADFVIPNNVVLITVPMLAIQRNDYSDIEGQNVRYEDYLSERYWQNFRE